MHLLRECMMVSFFMKTELFKYVAFWCLGDTQKRKRRGTFSQERCALGDECVGK